MHRSLASGSLWLPALLGLILVGSSGCGDRSASVSSPNDDGVASASSESGAAGTRSERVPGLTYEIPSAWERQEPETGMRLAQYRVPGPGGDASLILFRFPGGGSADANVARWIGQFQQPDGSSSTERASVQNSSRGDLSLTRLDVRGLYEGQQMPGAPPQPAIEDARLLALVVEGPGDPYFFKLLGPSATVDTWADAWRAFNESIRAD